MLRTVRPGLFFIVLMIFMHVSADLITSTNAEIDAGHPLLLDTTNTLSYRIPGEYSALFQSGKVIEPMTHQPSLPRQDSRQQATG
jgi:hypothetical protein